MNLFSRMDVYQVLTKISLVAINTYLQLDLACQVTERKHRAVKSASLFVFRSLEHTTLAHILNARRLRLEYSNGR